MDQTLNVFKDIKSGVIWSDKTYAPTADLVFMSAPTYLVNRDKWRPVIQQFDIYIVDEAHDCTSDGYKKLLSDIPEDKIVLGLSATFYLKSDGRGHTYWEDILEPVVGYELLEMGIVPKRKAWSVDMNVDFSKVKMTGNDYNTTSLYGQMRKQKKLYGNMIASYHKYNPDKLPAISFCVNIQHCLDVAEQFKNEKITPLIIHSKLPNENKKQFDKNLKYYLKNKIPFIICSVDMLSRGVDIPELKVGLMMRPTKSKLLFFQQAGRLTRKENMKDPDEKVIIIDFTGNIEKNKWDNYAGASPDTENADRRKRTTKKTRIRRCFECGAINNIRVAYCIVCKAFLTQTIDVDHLNAEMKEVDFSVKEDSIVKKIKQNNFIKDKYGLSDNYVWSDIIKRFGEDIFFKSENVPENVKESFIIKNLRF